MQPFFLSPNVPHSAPLPCFVSALATYSTLLLRFILQRRFVTIFYCFSAANAGVALALSLSCCQQDSQPYRPKLPSSIYLRFVPGQMNSKLNQPCKVTVAAATAATTTMATKLLQLAGRKRNHFVLIRKANATHIPRPAYACRPQLASCSCGTCLTHTHAHTHSLRYS